MKKLRKRVERGRDAIVADVTNDRVERKRVERGHISIVVGAKNERKRREIGERRKTSM